MNRIKTFFLMLTALFAVAFTSCSSDDNDDSTLSFTTAENQINSYLAGTWVGDEYAMSTTTIYKTETIKFVPLAQPKEVKLTQPGEYVNIDKTFKLIGKAHMVVGFGNDRKPINPEGEDYYYCFDASDMTISLLRAYNDEVYLTKIDSRNIKKESGSKFFMKPTGLADLEANWITFEKIVNE